MSIITLDKITLIGGITPSTPVCVIHNIALSYGMSDEYIFRKPLETIIQELNKIKKIDIDIEDDSQISILARFINCKEEMWNAFCLMRAFFHLIDFDLSSFRFDCNEFKEKTVENPLSIDVITTFRLCKYYSLATRRSDTFEDLISKLKGKRNFFSLNNSDEERFDETSLESIFSFLNSNPNTIFKYLHPKNKNHSVLFCAMAFDIDVTPSEDPVMEYFTLVQGGSYSYSPHDENFRKIFSLNPSFFNIRERFNPRFEFLYDSTTKILLSCKEGYRGVTPTQGKVYTPEQVEDAVRYTKSVYSLPNFYSGKHPFASEKTPIELEDTSNLDPKECVSYGDYTSNIFYTFKMDELRDYFSYRKNFCNPLTEKSIFSESEITKLLGLCSIGNSEASKNLKECILSIRKLLRSYSPEEIRLLQYFERNKEIILYLLRKILDISMYMRGWGVTTLEYPLTSQQCYHTRDDDEKKIDDNTFSNILELNNYIKENSATEEGKECIILVLSLPLVDFRHPSHFIRNVDPQRGLTIGERLVIVEKNETEYACIRMSSNCLCASAYKYLKFLGEELPFKIEDVSNIS